MFRYLRVICLSWLILFTRGDQQSHVFKESGLLAGVSAYGHMTFDLDLDSVDQELDQARRLTDVFEASHIRSNRTKFLQRLDMYEGSVERRVSQLFREWDNIKLVFVDNLPGQLSVTQSRQVEERPKRFIFTSIALVSGVAATVSSIFSVAALSSMSETVDRGDQNHMIEILQQHERRTTFLEDKVVRLNKTLDYVLNEITLTGSLAHLDSLMIYINAYLGILEEQVGRIRAGLRALLNHQITPALLDSMSLYDALRRLGKRAQRHGYMFPTEAMLSAVYSLPTSFLMLPSRKLRVFVHLPLMKQGTVMKLYEFVPMPIILNGTNYHLSMDSVPGLLAINEDQDGFTVLPYTQLDDCSHIANLLVCKHHNVLMKEFQSSCLASLWKEDGVSAARVCSYNVEPARFIVRQLTGTDFAVYHPTDEKLRIECPSGSNMVMRFTGSKLIKLEPNCRALNDHYSFISERNYGLSMSVEMVNYTVNVEELMGEDYDSTDLHQWLKGTNVPIPVRQLRKEFHFNKKAWSFKWDFGISHLLTSFSSVLSTIAILILFACFVRYCGATCVKSCFKCYKPKEKNSKKPDQEKEVRAIYRKQSDSPATDDANTTEVDLEHGSLMSKV